MYQEVATCTLLNVRGHLTSSNIASRLQTVLKLYQSNDHSQLHGRTGMRQAFQEVVIYNNYVSHLIGEGLVRSTPRHCYMAGLRTATWQIDLLCGKYKHPRAKTLGKLIDSHYQLYCNLDRLLSYTKMQCQNVMWDEDIEGWVWRDPTPE